MPITRYTLVFFAPKDWTRSILNALFDKFPKVLGRIGQYDHCAFISRGTGQFKLGPETNPAIGSVGQVEYVEEDRVELVVNDQGQKTELKNAIEELKKTHPYEQQEPRHIVTARSYGSLFEDEIRDVGHSNANRMDERRLRGLFMIGNHDPKCTIPQNDLVHLLSASVACAAI